MGVTIPRSIAQCVAESRLCLDISLAQGWRGVQVLLHALETAQRTAAKLEQRSFSVLQRSSSHTDSADLDQPEGRAAGAAMSAALWKLAVLAAQLLHVQRSAPAEQAGVAAAAAAGVPLVCLHLVTTARKGIAAEIAICDAAPQQEPSQPSYLKFVLNRWGEAGSMACCIATQAAEAAAGASASGAGVAADGLPDAVVRWAWGGRVGACGIGPGVRT